MIGGEALTTVTNVSAVQYIDMEYIDARCVSACMIYEIVELEPGLDQEVTCTLSFKKEVRRGREQRCHRFAVRMVSFSTSESV